eukprot:COSAG03_NODE_13503_length_500_cov_2.054863_1_plen_24_part_10
MDCVGSYSPLAGGLLVGTAKLKDT